jgi:hypothetical protein
MALEGHLWEKPASPHALDDEFEDTVLDPSWEMNGVVNYVGLDPYAAIGGATRVQIHTDHRRSWLMTQGDGNQFTKLYTFPANSMVWSRQRFDSKGSKASADTYAGVIVTATTAGVMSVTNYMRLLISEVGSGQRVHFSKRQSNVITEIAFTNSSLATRVKCIEYVMLHKIGSTFHAWCMGQSGEKIYLGSTVFAGDETLDRAGLLLGGTGLTPGTAVAGADFFRIVESATYLP